MITPYQAQYLAYNLTIKYNHHQLDRLSQSLYDASVDLKPHQMQAALFALKQPLDQGALLADEVGLGKTIEAGLVISQYWAEAKRHIVVVSPASLRKQWESELQEKFHIPATVVDTTVAKTWKKQGKSLFDHAGVIIVSYEFVHQNTKRFDRHLWQLVVIDEAHNLRNTSTKRPGSIQKAFHSAKKLLLTATPLQNSVKDLYGLMQLVDKKIFGDEKAFTKRYGKGQNQQELKQRITPYFKRTLRRDVLEYIQYTQRHSQTVTFDPTPDEQAFYDAVNDYLATESLNALPEKGRHLTTMVIRKVIESSIAASVETLKTMRQRLKDNSGWDGQLDDDITKPVFDDQTLPDTATIPQGAISIDNEIAWLDQLIAQGQSITTESKALALVQAIENAFAYKNKNAPRKATVFTESVRTQYYLRDLLISQGYHPEQIVLYNGQNQTQQATAIYEQWVAAHPDSATGNRSLDQRKALLDYFKNHAPIMIATEAAAEGLNLQFCAIVINYDLPWNPQRVEQRIGRCHRYGQRYDVVVMNFINRHNETARRLHELMEQKLQLFDGVFGASDAILGQLVKGVDFEKNILRIYNECRTPEQIEKAFDALQARCDAIIQQQMHQTYDLLLENFDDHVQSMLKLDLDAAQQRLDIMSRYLWLLAQYVLQDRAVFDHQHYTLTLQSPISETISPGTYYLLHQSEAQLGKALRLHSPLGQYVLQHAQTIKTPDSVVHLVFDYQHYLEQGHGGRLMQVEQWQHDSGAMALSLVSAVSGNETEEDLLFTILTDNKQILSSELAEQLMQLPAKVETADPEPGIIEHLLENHQQAIESKRQSISQERSTVNQQEAQRIEDWIQDQIEAKSIKLDDIRHKINDITVQLRNTIDPSEQLQLNKKLRQLDQDKRKARDALHEAEDDLIDKRERMIAQVKEQLQQVIQDQRLMLVTWEIR